MYSKISIKNFREIGSLDVKGLRRINLIVGRNNSGKTTFFGEPVPSRWGDESSDPDDARTVAWATLGGNAS